MIGKSRCIVYPHPQPDVVQLNAPEYDPDIDGQPDPVTDIQSHVAQFRTTHNLFPDTNRPESQPSSVLDDTDHPGHQDTEPSRAEHLSDYRPQLEDIPELEDNEENWEEDQCVDTDFIYHHNTRKVTDYIVSTLLILRKLQNRDTVLTIAQHQA